MRTKRTIRTTDILVDLDYALNYLSVDLDNTAERVIIAGLIHAAVLDMEAFCGADIVEADYAAYLTEEEVESFTLPETAAPPRLYYRNAAGDWGELIAGTDYTLKSDCGVLSVKLLIPPTLGDFVEVYRLDYVSGYTAASFPENAKLGVLLHVSKSYDVRMDEGEERNLQRTSEILWRPYKIYQT
jgi:hypothetical protein